MSGWSCHLKFKAPLPILQSDKFGSYAARNAYRKRWHQRVAAEFPVRALLPPEPLKRVRVECVRHSAARPDHSNLVYSYKPVIDGLIRCGVLSDDNPNVIEEEKYRWEKVPPGHRSGTNSFIEVMVSELPED